MSIHLLSTNTRDPRLPRAQAHAARGEVLQAEIMLRAILKDDPTCGPARLMVAEYLADRDSREESLAMLQPLASALIGTPPPATEEVAEAALRVSRVQWQVGSPQAVCATLEWILAGQPRMHMAWLMLGEARDVLGDTQGALRARHRAFYQARLKGLWTSQNTTEPHLLRAVLDSLARFNGARREQLMGIVDQMRTAHGAQSMQRVARALTGYLGEWDATPPDPTQRPKFFYFPDLPPGPYHDPRLQPWCATLVEAWPEMRREALELLQEDENFEDFFGFAPGHKAPEHMGGDADNPSWDAFFFYRHARRYDDHHARAPVTSSVLESVELCRVRNQAPEILFSVLRPQSTIMPHYGVTNTRLVFHLPLLVPEDCALDVMGHGEHAWQEGRPMMFDDTYRHRAWNRSNHTRTILLMDCWNPHLTGPEKEAVRLVVEAIDGIEN